MSKNYHLYLYFDVNKDMANLPKERGGGLCIVHDTI